jgi:hypothetical protein
MLNNRKQIADGNETGIILPPYRRGALYRYPINRTDDTSVVSNEKLPPIYLNISDLFCLIPKMPVQIKINNTADIGDMRPIGTFPSIPGILIRIYSISQVKLKRYSIKIRPQ